MAEQAQERWTIRKYGLRESVSGPETPSAGVEVIPADRERVLVEAIQEYKDYLDDRYKLPTSWRKTIDKVYPDAEAKLFAALPPTEDECTCESGGSYVGHYATRTLNPDCPVHGTEGAGGG